MALHPARPTKATKKAEPWLIRGLLRGVAAGPPIVGRLTIEHYMLPGVEVTGHVLRGLPVGEIRSKALEWLSSKQITSEVLGATPAEMRWARDVTAEAAKTPLSRGRQGYPVDHYRRIALRAVELHASGVRGVTGTLANEEGRPVQTIRDWIHRAREEQLGFLMPTKRGRTDFRPGPGLYAKGESHA